MSAFPQKTESLQKSRAVKQIHCPAQYHTYIYNLGRTDYCVKSVYLLTH